jgi:cytochrome c-type biogenesis protein CcmH/NrfG
MMQIRYMTLLVCIYIFASALACSSEDKPSHKSASVNVDAEIEKIRQQLHDSPNSAFLHNQLAALSATKGDWSTFQQEIETAEKLDPENPINFFQAAQIYKRRGLIKEEEEALKRTAVLDPQNPVVRFQLAEIYESQAKPEEANAEFREAKRLIESLQSNQRSSAERIQKGIYYDKRGSAYGLAGIDKAINKRLPQ